MKVWERRLSGSLALSHSLRVRSPCRIDATDELPRSRAGSRVPTPRGKPAPLGQLESGDDDEGHGDRSAVAYCDRERAS
jgi:hypothetical protein